ncbi:phage tail protein [Citrobacter freundii]|uniref:tail fiber assembly protein n=1 Tax=Citrobacter freundii complex TaxID=1344959 RepID=UPI000C805222|nr:tail fiber assembly protein [Citrobacter freundii]PMD01582.1 phage tail protein [Citrobacter freundii]WLV33022.1 tail fiber assembly protein [Citrobacter freundii]HCC8366058.1 tail fiber assembly protein [Citrobacter freundii]HCJ7430154.1 tail fiber assembly protein [Citrobacter freundii]HEG1909166.1 tail fiber assembly protein [Citrobacter freundii]
MKYYIYGDSNIYAFEDDADESFILSDMKKINEKDALSIANPPPTQSALIEIANANKTELRRIADDEISWLRDAIESGIATDAEFFKFEQWRIYRILLMRVDTVDTNISWPQQP